MPERLLKSPTTTKVSAPKSHVEWTKLMRQVISRAEALQHRQLPGLRNALVTGGAEAYLRKLGIISLTDLEREFPLP